MALEDMLKGGNIVTGLAIGVGSVIVAPLIVPALTGLLRPVAKTAIKGGIVVYDWGRQAAAQVGEATSDMVAEVRADAQHARPPSGADTIKPGEAAAA